jgi:hypothetical protein
MSRQLLILLSVLSLLSGTLFVASTALAVNNTGAFQLEGNPSTTDRGTPPVTGNDDADRVCYQDAINPVASGGDGLSAAAALARCGINTGTTNATAVQWIDSSGTPTIFTGGGSKDPQNPGTDWLWKPKDTIPDKDTIDHTFAARYSLAPDATNCPVPVTTPPTTTCEVIYFGVDRFDNSGDAQLGFWFFKSKVSLTNISSQGGFKFSGNHQNGDLLLISQFSNGGSTSTIEAHLWDDTCKKAAQNVVAQACSGANLRLQQRSTAANCATTAPQAPFCGIVNATTTPSTWTFVDKTTGDPANQYLQGEYYEAGVNLSSLGIGDECFPTFLAESRSSTSTTATLKDFALGNFQNCSAIGQTTPSSSDAQGNNGSVSPGTPVTDTMTVTGSGTTTPPFPTSSTTAPGRGNNVIFKICGPITAPATCTTGGTIVGAATGVALAPTATPGKSSATSAQVNTAANPLGPGRYCFSGTWAGDDNYPDGASDTSSRECFTVNDTTTTTSAQNWLPNDSGTITAAGGTALSGTLSFTLYDSDNCTGTVLYEEDTDSVTPGVQPFSFTNATSPVTRNTSNLTVKVSTSKTVSWKVVFASTNSNVSGSNHCEKTQLTITN